MFDPGRSLLAIGWALAVGSAAHGAGVLYDAALGTLPSAQNWQYQANPNNGPVSQQVSAGVLTMDSTLDRADRAGYPSRLPTIPPLPPFSNHPLVGTLDRTQGFTLRIDARLDAEGHSTTHRAGFSLLVVCDDLRAIEIGFWTNRIWAQDDDTGGGVLFTQAEAVDLDTTASQVIYELSIDTDHYRLFADGSPILGGPLRDYTNASGLAGLVYSTENLVFFGDNTSSADARAEVSLIVLTEGPRQGPACPGDIDWNGTTDVFDFQTFASNFGQSVPLGTRGDLDLDGDVDVLDFNIFAADFGCPVGR